MIKYFLLKNCEFVLVDYNSSLEARNESCQQVTNCSGQITSQTKLVKTPKNVVLVTVQENYTIWLNFNGYVNQENHLLKVRNRSLRKFRN